MRARTDQTLSAKAAMPWQRTLLAAAVLATLAPVAWAQQPDTAVKAATRPASMGASANSATPFELGTVNVAGQRPALGEVGDNQVGSVVTEKDMRQSNRQNVGDALNLLSGVSISTNSRNEKTIAVRGFDSRQVPLFIDGIPVYVPYDGYVDFNRFATTDLAGIQVAKGFSSVAYGPNTLGGAINLISRKPTEALEGDVSVGFGSGNEKQMSANAGTNQGAWYLQTGVSYIESDYFRLSSDFVPTATEDGGRRENSYRKDSKVSLKLGLTPNATDEYAISYYKQDGEKGQPPSTDRARYWQWPFWDKESLYFVSNTALGDKETLKVRLYHDRYANDLKQYTDGSYTVIDPGRPLVTGRSVYRDQTTGGSIELESVRLAAHTLRLVTHYKLDEHKEEDANDVENAHFKDTFVSLAAEDTIALSARTSLSLGVSRHELRPDKVYKFDPGRPNTPQYELPAKSGATDLQAGLYHDLSDTARLYTTVARKTRLPSLKDRYSARMGSAVPNPNLGAEESTNYEVGYQGKPWHGTRAEAAVFYSDIKDKIQRVEDVLIGVPKKDQKYQMQNVGKVRAQGIELGLSSRLNPQWELGGNYTFTKLDNISDPATRITGIPRHKVTAHALYRPMEAVEIVGFAEHNSKRWVSDTEALKGLTTLNLKTVYHPTKQASVELGGTNLTDKNYALSDGFPSSGRMVFANANYQF